MEIWIPTYVDYDTHILNRLKTITLSDGTPVHVSYYMPESEGELDVDLLRPAVTFYMYDQVHDIKREQSQLTLAESVNETEVSTVEKPTPVKLFYQFSVLTDYQTHKNEILEQFNKLFPFRGYITLTSPDGEEVSYDFFQTSFQSTDTYMQVPSGGTTKERIFRAVYRYHLYTEIMEHQEEVFNKVLEVNNKVSEIQESGQESGQQTEQESGGE